MPIKYQFNSNQFFLKKKLTWERAWRFPSSPLSAVRLFAFFFSIKKNNIINNKRNKSIFFFWKKSFFSSLTNVQAMAMEPTLIQRQAKNCFDILNTNFRIKKTKNWIWITNSKRNSSNGRTVPPVLLVTTWGNCRTWQ